ncbi:histidine phosphatase family protein [Martelella alba]|uniref:Histidine phosphatase family protein n=1 Tax=Martelella alba TaxID=2590451 RepID=A0A506UDE5_9HYPH|nr:histidine phosphatase family protein [Martelella alba]TPW31151.1 histidine phosphatase family protein [Martelella alba]
MYALYITHPQVAQDPAVPVPEWPLSALGRQRMAAFAARSVVQDLGHIVSSAETKAVEAAGILAAATGLGVEIVAETHENDRSATGYLAGGEFEAARLAFLGQPDVSYRGWERAEDAQARIVKAVQSVLALRQWERPIAFVGHGAVGTLLKCHLKGGAISADEDQPGGGGNIFCFSLSDCALLCDWTPMELWEGWPK